MKAIYFIFLILEFSGLGCCAVVWTPEKRIIETEQIDLWREKLKESSSLENIDKILFLQQGLKNMGRRKSMEGHDPAVAQIYEDIQNNILAISGHAEYFATQIKIEREKWTIENDRRAKSGDKPYWGPYDDFKYSAIQTLGHLPSPETVRVLGELLQDREDTSNPPYTFGSGTNAGFAADALKALVAEPPVLHDGKYNRIGDIEIWQTWYEQIKSGNRTFRFEGDPVEYDLTGPAPKDKLVRIERDRKRDAEREAGERRGGAEAVVAADPGVSRPAAGWGIVAACVALLVGVWYFFRGRRAI